MAKQRGRPKSNSRKEVKVKLLTRRHAGKVTEPYQFMEEIIKAEREDLKDLKIGIAWHCGWRADPDGLLKLGQCKKRTDLDRELDEYDFIILLNEQAWAVLKKKERQRLMYHELCHAQLSIDENGERRYDDRGRHVCRIRKHDYEEFREVIEKFGDKHNLSKIAQAEIADADRPLLKDQE